MGALGEVDDEADHADHTDDQEDQDDATGLVDDVLFRFLLPAVDIEGEGIWRGRVFWYKDALLTGVFCPLDPSIWEN